MHILNPTEYEKPVNELAYSYVGVGQTLGTNRRHSCRFETAQ